jgi:hypothetical protein
VRCLLVLLACLVVAACGAGEPAGNDAARHLDPRSDAVVAIDLDYDGGNWQQLKQLYSRAVDSGLWEGERFSPPTLDGALGAAAGYVGVSFADDIRPLLGGTLYVGVAIEPAAPLSPAAQDVLEQVDLDATSFTGDDRPVYRGYDGKPLKGISARQVEAALGEEAQRQPRTALTASYHVEDADALAHLIDKLREQGLEPKPIPGVDDAERLAEGVAVVGGDTLVGVVGDDGEESDRLLRERLGGGDGPELPELGDDLIAARAAPTLLGAWLDRAELDRALATRAGTALRGAEARLRLEQDAARGSARFDFEGLPDEELPLPAAGDLALPAGEAVASASADQSYTTVFLARLARELWPDSRFVQRVEAYEQAAGVRFEDEVLRQFAGPSFSVLRRPSAGRPTFGARSTLADPAAMRERLDSLAPALPRILEGLQGLGSTGLTGLLFVAPDAPLTPAAFGLLAQVAVNRLEGTADEQLYEVSGLDPDNFQPGPDRVVYGLVGDAFVVASSEEMAREVAAMPTEPAPEAATRLRVDVAALIEGAAGSAAGEEVRLARELLEGAEASASAQDGDVVAEAELRWKR